MGHWRPDQKKKERYVFAGINIKGGGVTGIQWLQWGGVERGGGRRIKDEPTPDNQRYTGLYPNVANLSLNIGPESRGSLSRCSGMELHHPIISNLWDLGGQTKNKKEKNNMGLSN